MNIQTSIQNTPAEQAIIDAFSERLSMLPGDGDVMLKRDAAIEAIKAGLPTRRIEAWHYTDLRRLLAKVPAFDDAADAQTVPVLIEGSTVLPVLNGTVGKAPALDGVSAQSVAEKLRDGTYAPALERQGDDDAIGALNAALVADGWFLDIADGTVLEKPIELQNVQAGGQVHTRFAARIGDGVTATIVERQAGSGGAFVSSVDNVVIGDGANVTWLIVQEEPDTATYLGQFNAWIGKDARFSLFVMNAGGKLVRQEVRVATKGEGSDFQLRGVNLLSGETHTDVTMVLDHAVPHTGSREIATSIPGRVLGTVSPERRSASPAKKSKMCAARTVSPMPSGRVLPSSRESSAPSSSLRRRISSAAPFRMSWRCWMPERDHEGNASLAAAMATFTSSAVARA